MDDSNDKDSLEKNKEFKSKNKLNDKNKIKKNLRSLSANIIKNKL